MLLICLSFDVFGAERGNRPDGEARTGRSEPGFNYGSSWQARGRAGAAHRWRAEGVGRWRARGARGWATTGEWCPPGGEALGRAPGAHEPRFRPPVHTHGGPARLQSFFRA